MWKLIVSGCVVAVLGGCTSLTLYTRYMTQDLPEQPLCERVPPNFLECLFEEYEGEEDGREKPN